MYVLFIKPTILICPPAVDKYNPCAHIRYITHVRRHAIEATHWGSEVTRIYMADGGTTTRQQ